MSALPRVVPKFSVEPPSSLRLPLPACLAGILHRDVQRSHLLLALGHRVGLPDQLSREFAIDECRQAKGVADKCGYIRIARTGRGNPQDRGRGNPCRCRRK
jgi:hypothetical protein